MGDWIPIVYYGTEQGFNGGSDPNNRESLWPHMSTEHPLYKFIQKLAQFRKSLGKEWLQQEQVRLTEYGCEVIIDRDYTAYLKKNTALFLCKGFKSW